MGVGTAGATATPSPVAPSSSRTPASKPQSDIDILTDLFTSPPSTTASQAVSSGRSFTSDGDDILNLFGDSAPTAGTAPTSPSSAPLGGGDVFASLGGLSLAQKPQSRPSSQSASSPISLGSPTSPRQHQVYSKNGLQIYFRPARDATNPNIVNITVNFGNDGSQGTISGVLFQAAVPKTQRLQMQPPSSTVIAKEGEATQVLRVANPNQVGILAAYSLFLQHPNRPTLTLVMRRHR